MNDLEIATLKDNILIYLQKHPDIPIDLDVIKKDIKLFTMPKGVVRACVEEMDADKVIICHYEEGEGAILLINDKGEKLLLAGGYTKPVQDILNERQQQEADKHKARELTDLNIKNLKRAKWFSIAAIIISALALIISIIK